MLCGLDRLAGAKVLPLWVVRHSTSPIKVALQLVLVTAMDLEHSRVCLASLSVSARLQVNKWSKLTIECHEHVTRLSVQQRGLWGDSKKAWKPYGLSNTHTRQW